MNSKVIKVTAPGILYKTNGIFNSQEEVNQVSHLNDATDCSYGHDKTNLLSSYTIIDERSGLYRSVIEAVESNLHCIVAMKGEVMRCFYQWLNAMLSHARRMNFEERL